MRRPSIARGDDGAPGGMAQTQQGHRWRIPVGGRRAEVRGGWDLQRRE
jgi:hypothetical protein